MALRVPRTRAELAAVGELGIWQPPPGLDELLQHAAALPPPEPRAVCHGDLHFRQLLVDGGELTGIIDWVDVCRSDPGVDLQLAWSLLPPAARDDFVDEYGPVTESLLRARVVALFPERRPCPLWERRGDADRRGRGGCRSAPDERRTLADGVKPTVCAMSVRAEPDIARTMRM
jgi:Phosphotransferase enzyme family